MRCFAGSFPGRRESGKREGVIGEALELRPDSGVEDADDDVGSEVGIWP